MLKEFKTFVSRGNVVELAVGVIVGSAFSKIISSIVDDIIMPIMGIILGGLDFSRLSITFNDASINYGMFIQNVIDFLIVSFCLFMVIKFINKISHKEKKKEEKKVVPSEEVVLLQEIRDLLKNKK